MREIEAKILTCFSEMFFLIDSFNNDDNFLAVLLVMAALFFLIATIIGVVLGLIFIVILIGLIGAGLISTSVLVGLQQKSISKGFKTFFVFLSVLGCTIVSIIFFWFTNLVKEWWDSDISILIGIICGMVSGFLLGLLMFNATKKTIQFLKAKYVNKIESQPN